MKCSLKIKMQKNAAYLHSNWKVILSLGRKEDINSFFLERRIAGGRSSNLDDVQLATGSSSYREAEERALLSVTLHLELAEGGGVTLDGLGDVPLDAVELHGANHTVVLGRDTDQQQPVHGFVGPVVDDLTRKILLEQWPNSVGGRFV